MFASMLLFVPPSHYPTLLKFKAWFLCSGVGNCTLTGGQTMFIPSKNPSYLPTSDIYSRPFLSGFIQYSVLDSLFLREDLSLYDLLCFFTTLFTLAE